METPHFFLTKQFWVLFTIAVIIGLYLYGMKMIGDKTEIGQTKNALAFANDELIKCTQENEAKAAKISELQKEVEMQINTITQNNNLISRLKDSINRLANRPPVIEYKYNTVYKDKPESYHPYGKGYGKLTLYKTCNCYNLKFWIDGEYIGILSMLSSSDHVSCGENGTVNKIVLAGKHHIHGEDQENHSWDFYVTVNEDQCYIHGLKLK